VGGFGQIRQSQDEAVVVDADGVSGASSDFPVHACVLKDDESDAAPRAGAVVLDQPVIDLSPRRGELGEDRRLDEAVPQRHPANSALLEEGALAVCGNSGKGRARCGHNASLWWEKGVYVDLSIGCAARFGFVRSSST
jgi:hypothetical protein